MTTKAPVRYGSLTRDARELIRWTDLTIADYIRFWFPDGTWRGDSCGCPDDRCRDGYHHDLDDDCGCLPVCVRQVQGLPL